MSLNISHSSIKFLLIDIQLNNYNWIFDEISKVLLHKGRIGHKIIVTNVMFREIHELKKEKAKLKWFSLFLCELFISEIGNMHIGLGLSIDRKGDITFEFTSKTHRTLIYTNSDNRSLFVITLPHDTASKKSKYFDNVVIKNHIPNEIIRAIYE